MPPRSNSRTRSRHLSLSEQLESDKIVTKNDEAVPDPRSRPKRVRGPSARDDDESAAAAFDGAEVFAAAEASTSDRRGTRQSGAASSRATRRLLQATRGAKKNRHEGDDDDDDEEGADGDVPVGDDDEDAPESILQPPHPEGDDDDDDDPNNVALEYDDQESVATTAEEFDDLGAAYGIDEDEARILERLQPQTNVQRRTLADIILEKIKEKEDAKAQEAADETGSLADTARSHGGAIDGVDPRIRKVYLAIGAVLKTYTSGRIPKAFKSLPHIKNWETLLFLTGPHEWSPHATYAATRIFAAHLNERMAQRFYSAVLYPIIHDYMTNNKNLHPALYMAVKKALFKPIAFYKGFLLPLCEEGECTLREALVIGSVLQKMHLPPVPTAVAIAKLTFLPFTSSTCVLLRVLIDKRMALPFQPIDALVKYFHKFTQSHKGQTLPVLWHQTFLTFVQRYKGELTSPQIELIKQACTAHFHHMITPEVRRELAVLATRQA
mgnify:FL=1